LGRRWLHQTCSARAQRVSFVLLDALASSTVLDPNADQMLLDGVELLDDTPDGRHRRLSRCSRSPLWFSLNIVARIRYSHLEYVAKRGSLQLRLSCTYDLLPVATVMKRTQGNVVGAFPGRVAVHDLDSWLLMRCLPPYPV
jgi:hypothetical protein